MTPAASWALLALALVVTEVLVLAWRDRQRVADRRRAARTSSGGPFIDWRTRYLPDAEDVA